MKSLLLSLIFVLSSITFALAQSSDAADSSDLPYYEIPAYPETYTPGNVAARLVDGLGFRYYWASEGLREEDLAYKPSEDGRTTAETLDHIYGLSRIILNGALKKPNGGDSEELTYVQKREKTLQNLKTVSDILKGNSDKGLEEFIIIFQRGDQTSEFPFWNMINGPISDAIYHVGQIVSYRRASGNPIDPRISQFSGQVRK